MAENSLLLSVEKLAINEPHTNVTKIIRQEPYKRGRIKPQNIYV